MDRLVSAATTCRLLLVHVTLLLLAFRDVLALDVVERQRVRRLVTRDDADKVPERRLLEVPLGQELEVPLRDDRGGSDLDLGLCEGTRTKKARRQGQSNDTLGNGVQYRRRGKGRQGVCIQVIGSFGVKSLSPVPSLRPSSENPQRSINSSTRFRGEVEHAEGNSLGEGDEP